MKINPMGPISRDVTLGFGTAIRTAFVSLLMACLVLLLIYQFNPTIIDRYLGLDYLLAAVFVLGAILALSVGWKRVTYLAESPHLLHYLLVSFLAFLTWFLMLYRLDMLAASSTAYIVSLASGILVFVISAMAIEAPQAKPDSPI